MISINIEKPKTCKSCPFVTKWQTVHDEPLSLDYWYYCPLLQRSVSPNSVDKDCMIKENNNDN